MTISGDVKFCTLHYISLWRTFCSSLICQFTILSYYIRIIYLQITENLNSVLLNDKYFSILEWSDIKELTSILTQTYFLINQRQGNETNIGTCLDMMHFL